MNATGDEAYLAWPRMGLIKMGRYALASTGVEQPENWMLCWML